MLTLNTGVAKVQSTAIADVCTATSSLLTSPCGDGSVSPQTSLVLIFEEGQERYKLLTDDQTACAFRVRRSPSRIGMSKSHEQVVI